MPEIPVNGKVLKWARTIRGLSIEDAALRLRVPREELSAYESGAQKPLVGFLRNMSRAYQINFSSLFMPEPLPIENPPADYRTRSVQQQLSFKTIIAREEVTEALEMFEEIADGSPQMVKKLKIGMAQLSDPPEAVAERERGTFGVSMDEQRSWHGQEQARREWRRRIEGRGVFTYMIPMPPEEISGFSILRGNLAAICVNDKEPNEGAKVFTLFHEYCHLLLRKDGISDENEGNHVERFCNRFAASFLVPRIPLADEIRGLIGDVDSPFDFTDAHVRKLANRFKVSNRAMALRLEETGFAPTGFYFRRTAPWDQPKAPKPIVPSSTKMPSALKIRIKRIGTLHVTTALRAEKNHVISALDASELIGLRPKTFKKLWAEVQG